MRQGRARVNLSLCSFSFSSRERRLGHGAPGSKLFAREVSFREIDSRKPLKLHLEPKANIPMPDHAPKARFFFRRLVRQKRDQPKVRRRQGSTTS